MAAESKGKEPSLDEELTDQEICPSDWDVGSRSTDRLDASDEEEDYVCIRIENNLEKVSRSSVSFISKVPYQLRQENESAYEPRIISIGPYYRRKPHLRAMECHKLSYLKLLLERRTEDRLETYVEAMRFSEYDARRCYAESLYMSSEEFLEMLILDGCFVIELIRKFASNELSLEEDDLFRLNFNHSIVGQELLLVENQLPFFVLDKLFKMTKTPTGKDETLDEMALKFFSRIVPGPGIQIENYCPPSHQSHTKGIEHLLGLALDNWLPSPGGIKCYKQSLTDRKWKFIRSAKELSEQGIKFKKVSKEKTSSLFDINFQKGCFFQKGRFHIPALTINQDTERIFRNLIAYEQQFAKGPTYVMDYARLMNCLINHRNDVALLSPCGIIVNWLGSDEAVDHMFSKLNDFVHLSTTNFYYSKIFDDVNEYCEKRWTKWKASLRNKYVRAGAILFLLTFVQTVFTVISCFK